MIITNGRIITWGEANEILEDSGLLIQNGVIVKIGKINDLTLSNPKEEILDADGQLIMPGNICAHTHFYGAFARGMAIPGEPPKNFLEILKSLWWKLDKALDSEAVKYSTSVCLIDAIKHGTTTLIDHHASPTSIENSLDLIANEVQSAGLRASLCYEVTDRDGLDKAFAGINENLRFIKRVINKEFADNLIRAHFGLHASLTLSQETMEKCRNACPPNIGFHIHGAEGIVDQEDSLKKSGKRVIERLADFKMLGKSSIVAHGVHVNDKEIDLLAESGTWLTHQPRSNMNNAVGVAPIEKMLSAGVNVCLGNDGFSNAMWEEWKTAYLLQKDHHQDPRSLGGYDLIKIVIDNNANLASSIFNGLRIGEIVEGAAADLIFVDYHEFTPLHAGNLPWHILFGFREGMVTTTIVNGKVLMKNRVLTTLDEIEITRKAKESAIKTWALVQERG
ncbi:MAG: putative aminohydrolase SsnA [Anaerolineaceae bacterium]|nr:putative aminohydrolase SsnA [Anaerolineaceae bacterium]